MRQASTTNKSIIAFWFATVFLAVAHTATLADYYLVELKLEPSDIAEATIGDEIVVTLATAAAERLRTLTADNPGKVLRILFRSTIVKEMDIEAPMTAGVITVTAPSEALRSAMECWRKGCPGDDDDDEECD